ncbi:ubiquitin-conjugating enzyme protein 17 [Apiospora arundinis]
MHLGDSASRLPSGGAVRFNSRYPLKLRELYTREKQAQRYGGSEKAMFHDAWFDQMPLPELWQMSGANYELSSSVGGVASSTEETTMGATSTSPPRVATPAPPQPSTPSPPKPQSQPQPPQASSGNSERASFSPSCVESSKRRPVMCIGDAFINLMMDTPSPPSPSGVAPLSASPVLQVADEREVDDNSDDSDWDLAGGSEVDEEEFGTDEKDDKMPDLLNLLNGDDDSGLEDWDMV